MNRREQNHNVILDDKSVKNINSYLRPKPERPDPQPLQANAELSFQGSVVLGIMGFTLTSEERAILIRKNPKNQERIFPYLGGEEINTNPDQGFERYVINFGDMSLEQAERWPDLIQIVREKVKPERDKNNREQYKNYWWHYGEKRPALYAAIRDLPRCLVNSRVSKHLIFTWQPTDRIFGDSLYIYPVKENSFFSVLQSRIHEVWSRFLSSTLEDRLRYAATDCFANFPFPDKSQLTPTSTLEKIGQTLYKTRAQYMLHTNQGLTKVYNQLKDPDCQDPEVQHLRQLHQDLDAAVLAAYGWQDIPVPAFDINQNTPEFIAFADEIIDRLFALNAERVEQESNEQI